MGTSNLLTKAVRLRFEPTGFTTPGAQGWPTDSEVLPTKAARQAVSGQSDSCLVKAEIASSSSDSVTASHWMPASVATYA